LQSLRDTLWEITQPYGLVCRAEAACGSRLAGDEAGTGHKKRKPLEA